jgi:4-hydroxymandelate oxidase
VAEAVFTMGTTATAAIEDCVAVSRSPVWFLLYWQSDRGFNGELVSRMAALGAKAIIVTVDTPTPGDRRRQFRAGFKIPDSLATPYFKDRNTGVIKAGTAQRRAMPTWADIAWLRSLTTLPLILKGILEFLGAKQFSPSR